MSKRLCRYFIAAAPSSIDRNIYSASIPDLTLPAATPPPPKSLTDVSQASYYSASFSPLSGFYVLSYQGPAVPWQRVVQVDKTGELEINLTYQHLYSVFILEFKYELTTNKALNETSATFQMPGIARSTIMSDDYGMRLLPPSRHVLRCLQNSTSWRSDHLVWTILEGQNIQCFLEC